MMNDKKMDYENVMQDVYAHFHIYIYLKRKINKTGEVVRYISDIAYIDDSGKTTSIYKNDGKTIKLHKIPSSLVETFDEKNIERLEANFQ